MTKKKKPTKKQAAKTKRQASKTPLPKQQQAPVAKPDKAAKPNNAAKPATAIATVSAAPRPPAAAASKAKETAKEIAKPPRRSAPSDDAKSPKRPPVEKAGAPPGEGHRSNGKAAAKIGVTPDAVSEAALPLQTFAADMQRMAKQSVEQTAEVLERLRDAKSVEEVVSLQTTFMQQTFRRYTEFAGRISQLMTSSQASLFQQGQAAMRSFRSIASGSQPRAPQA